MLFERKTRVILDTNTLILPYKGIDIFELLHTSLDEPVKLCTTKGVMEELEGLIQKNKGKTGFGAKLGYILAKQKDLKILTSFSGHVDDSLVALATQKDVVVTQDKELIKRLREKGVRVLRYEQHHFKLQR